MNNTKTRTKAESRYSHLLAHTLLTSLRIVAKVDAEVVGGRKRKARRFVDVNDAAEHCRMKLERVFKDFGLISKCAFVRNDMTEIGSDEYRIHFFVVINAEKTISTLLRALHVTFGVDDDIRCHVIG